ncbi:tryptophan 2,3-dioxygenase [Halomonas sp. 328]|uniref:tryptophan 2,3-dioxygenase n=1 Tax=Halomonas sp. 328 TaxID=2776704 RepID=UPI0018A7C5CD|nr:tryptophan 2,3-dioxygenase [Halomonas sp. 328]MBF8221999.1 tryptophan 2,3-dioxygenase [Halomonas sp. 328]
MAEGKRAGRTRVDLAAEGVHWDPAMSYGQYLALEPLLACQTPLTDEHDEMLFIVIHQVSELWLKQCLHEAHAAAAHIAADQLRPAFKMLTRVARIQEQMIQAWEVLATLTPADYARFRDSLGQSSGFQSYQYRELEFLLGNKHPELVEVHRGHPEHYRRLTQILEAPSLYDTCLQLLARRGFALPDEVLDRDWREPYAPHPEVESAWAAVYGDTERHWDLYELAEKLVDTEYHFQQWRFSHMKTVQRIIGHKPGTGGTSGVGYLAKALELTFFPELWSVRTRM